MNGYQSGFISIIGCPNVGKSTLLNALIGQKISIVTDRAQTTRNKITGVLTRQAYQMIFLDTPGVTNPRNRLGDYMQKVAFDAMNEVEAILFVVDAAEGVRENDRKLIETLKKARAPIVGFVNKCDRASMGKISDAKDALEQSGICRTVLTGSAATREGLDLLEKTLTDHLTEGPQYFPDDMVTDQPERIICAELIREQTLKLLREEIPHGIGVAIERMEKRENRELMDIYATIYAERDSHKGIIIGKGGSMLKKIGAASRREIEWMLGCDVNLQVWVKIKEDWRNKPAVLHELGYE